MEVKLLLQRIELRVATRYGKHSAVTISAAGDGAALGYERSFCGLAPRSRLSSGERDKLMKKEG